MLTLAAAAEQSGLSKATIKRAAQDGVLKSEHRNLPTRTVNRHGKEVLIVRKTVVVQQSELDRWLANTYPEHSRDASGTCARCGEVKVSAESTRCRRVKTGRTNASMKGVEDALQ